jgi:hypothetical protein
MSHQSISDLGTNIIDVRFSPVSRHSRDQIGVVTNGWLQASAQEKYPLDRHGVVPPGWLQKPQLGEERAFC